MHSRQSSIICALTLLERATNRLGVREGITADYNRVPGNYLGGDNGRLVAQSSFVVDGGRRVCRHLSPYRQYLPGGYKVIDANGQSLAYFYARENDHDANTAGVLSMDEARRMASNFAELPELLTRG